MDAGIEMTQIERPYKAPCERVVGVYYCNNLITQEILLGGSEPFLS